MATTIEVSDVANGPVRALTFSYYRWRTAETAPDLALDRHTYVMFGLLAMGSGLAEWKAKEVAS